MSINLINKSARYAVISINDECKYHLKKSCDIFLNGKYLKSTDKVINCIYNLMPESDYCITVGQESISFRTDYEFVTLDVKKFGAYGNGVNDDTVYIQSAIMACPENSRVLIPKGTYKITNLFLKSKIRLEISKDAQIIADNNRYSHPVFPGMTESFDEKSEYNLGTWEGNPLDMFAGIITMINVEDIEIYGEGTVDGNSSKKDWWFDEKKVRGAFRPRMIFISHSKNISLIGLEFMNSPAWVIHPYFSEKISIFSPKITNALDSPNTDGIDVESSRDVNIIGAEFSLGDDCIAIKSGKIYMARYNGITERVSVSHCLMKNGHGAVTLGSEMSSGIKDIVVSDCEFIHTDRGLRVKTRRGRGNKAIIDNILFKDIYMDNVCTPLVLNSFYFCDPDGKSEYVQTRDKLPVDERTPMIKSLYFDNIQCSNAHFTCAYFLGLPEQKIELISMKNIQICFSDNPKSGFPAMHCGVQEMSCGGIIACNVKKIIAENVCVTNNTGDKFILKNVDEFINEEK